MNKKMEIKIIIIKIIFLILKYKIYMNDLMIEIYAIINLDSDIVTLIWARIINSIYLSHNSK